MNHLGNSATNLTTSEKKTVAGSKVRKSSPAKGALSGEKAKAARKSSATWWK